MRILIMCKYFFYIKTYFNRLPKDIQSEFLIDLKRYYDYARIARCIDLSKEVINECSRQDYRN